MDVVLDEVSWQNAEASDALSQSDPREGQPPSARTTLRVLADARAIVIGIVCEEPDSGGVVSFSVRRDASLNSEDHVRVVLGPFRDGRSGYVFAVNPSGARYDGLINPGGESENEEWDRNQNSHPNTQLQSDATRVALQCRAAHSTTA
jgi:hypothetical protein